MSAALTPFACRALAAAYRICAARAERNGAAQIAAHCRAVAERWEHEAAELERDANERTDDLRR